MKSTTWRPLAATVICLVAGCGGGGGSGDGGGGGGNGATHVIGGTVTGLKNTLILRDNGQDDLTIAANGQFAFPTRIASGRPYAVTVERHPSNPAQHCALANASGTVGTADVSNITVTCDDLPTAKLQAEAGVHSATLEWTAPAAGATAFNVYLSSASNCDITHVTSCPDGEQLLNATSPLAINRLRNGQAYFFRVETVFSNGARGLSNEAVARPNAIAFDNDIVATARAADGTVYLGGSFTRAGVTSGAAVPLDAATGRIAALNFPIVHGGEVFAIAADGSGGWYLGGSFTTIGGVARSHLAHVLANGSVDAGFDPKVDNAVRALAVTGGTVYAGGDFDGVGPPGNRVDRTCLAAFNAAGEVLPWNPVITCNFVATLAVGDDGTIYAGGTFSTNAGPDRTHLAAIGPDGAIRDGWNVGLDDGNGGGSARKLLVVGNTIYVAGDFTVVNSAAGPVERDHLAAIGTNGVVDPGFDPRPDGSVSGLVRVGAALYVAGNFSAIGPAAARAPRARLAALNAAGEVLPWQADANGSTETLAASGDVIYVGGNFASIGTTERHNIAAISVNGEVLPWHAAPSSDVHALTVQEGIVYAGGNFGAVDTVARTHLAALDANGALLPWAPAADNIIKALAIADDTIYAGGFFTQVNETTRNHLAAIDTAGHLTEWHPDAEGDLRALTIANDTVYVAGITAVDGKQRKGLAAIKRSGEVLDWSPAVEGSVFTLASTGTVVYVGGLFNALGGQRLNLIAVGAGGVGVIDPNFRPDPNDAVFALAIADNVLYAGGSFTNVGPAPRPRLAALDLTGAVLPNFQLNGTSAGSVRALNVQAGHIYFGGFFLITGPTERRNLAAVTTNGELLDWHPDSDGDVLALEGSGGTLYVAGHFTTLAGAARYSFGALSTEGTGELIP